MALLDALEASHATVLPQNKEHLEGYFGEDGIPTIRIIVASLYTGVLGYHSERSGEGNEQLHRLRVERMAHETATMKQQLSKPKYQLDSSDAISAVCGTKQMEIVSLLLCFCQHC